jgi:hypoxanthine-guanine phosphoribosyltransferase
VDNLIAPYRQKWQNCFPNVILNAALGDASKHSYYVAAKSGDLDAALILAIDLVNQEAIEKLATIIQNEKPLLVPVHAEEAISINRIPLAYAIILGRKLDLPVELNVVQSAKVSRTGSDGFSRLAFPPPFSGEPSVKADYAIILDDTLTQGGTLANLRGYLGQFGIQTLAATTLTGKNYSSTLAITDVTLKNLQENYHELEHWWISYFGYGFECLTESEARYILNSKKDVDAIRNRIIAERQAGFV